MDSLAAIKVTFFQECDEQLAELETGLLAMEGGDRDSETVNAVFRAVHSVKGGAGAFGLEPLVRFAHVFETTLDDMRSGKLAIETPVVRTMLRAADVLADHVKAAKDDVALPEGASAAVAAELAALCGGGPALPSDTIEGLDFQPVQFTDFDLGAAAPAEPAPPPFGLPAGAAPAEPPAMPVEPPAAAAGPSGPAAEIPAAAGEGRRTVAMRPHPALYAKANEAALLLRELGRLGPMQVELDASRLPLLADLQPEHSYLAWTATLPDSVDEASIREVFEFVDGDCDITLGTAAEPGIAPEPQPAAPPAAAPEAGFDITALLAHVRATVAPVDAANAASAAAAEALPPPAPPVVLHPAAAPAAKPAAPATPPSDAAAPPPSQTIRVDLDRVDRLINLVGELVINQAMLTQRVSESGLARSSSVAVGLDDLEQLTREIQDSVMAIRAQPVKSVFQRMPRLVREVAAMTGKQVRLVTEGEATEVDKTVIERLSDPITHMIRNAIDHGLESTEKRLAGGKQAVGTVRLAALHRGGRIVIEVGDDGGGIDRARVRQVAIDKGLIAAEAELSDEETDNLIFMPGFSTAAAISDISGRGVGMDVVRRSIAALGGRITITSRPGLGSTFTLSLPLTLAILDGMVVSVAGHTLVAPLTAIIETLQPKSTNVRKLGPDSPLIIVRDAYVPLIDVGLKLGYRDAPLPPTSGVSLLVETEGGGQAALLVDAIQGQRQVVIKSLEANYRSVPGIAAATILGDGRVALILDVDAVVSRDAPDPVPAAMPALAAAG